MTTPLAALLILSPFLFQSQGIDEVLRGWSSENAEVRERATREVLSRWKEWGEHDLSRLKRAAADPDSEVAGRAAETLDRIEIRRTLAGGKLETIPGIEDVVCRGGREERLRILKEAGDRWVRKDLRDEDLLVLAQWAEKRRWSPTVEELKLAAQQNHPHGDWSPVRPYHSLVRPFLDSKAGEIRTWALEFLAGCGSKEYEPAIAAHLKDPEAGVRAAAVRALGSLGGTEVPAQIAPFLADEFSEVRRRTIVVLSDLGCRDRHREIAERLTDPDQGVRAASADALGRFRAKEYGDRIAGLLDDPKSGQALSSAIKALGLLGAQRHAGAVAPLLKSDHWFWKLEAAQALGRMGAREHAGAIVPLLSDRDLRVMWEAAEALGRLGATDQVDRIAPLLRDSRLSIRAVAARTLGNLGAAERQKDILPLLGESPWPVRNDAAKALGQFGATEARKDLLRIIEDEKSNVCSTVVLALVTLGTDGLPAEERARWIESLGRLRREGRTEDKRAASVALVCLSPLDRALQRDALDQLVPSPTNEEFRTYMDVLNRIHEKNVFERLAREKVLARPVESWEDLEALFQDAGLRLDSKGPFPLSGRVSDGVRASPSRVLGWLLAEENVIPVGDGDRVRLMAGSDATESWRNRLRP